MNEQTLLPLPPAPPSRSLTLDQVRDFFAQASTAIAEHPRLGPGFRMMVAVGPEHTRAALAALYSTAKDDDERRLIRTARALSQLLCDAEAHESRQPGKARAVTVHDSTTPAAIAASAVLPLSLSQEDQNQEDPIK